MLNNLEKQWDLLDRRIVYKAGATITRGIYFAVIKLELAVGCSQIRSSGATLSLDVSSTSRLNLSRIVRRYPLKPPETIQRTPEKAQTLSRKWKSVRP